MKKALCHSLALVLLSVLQAVAEPMTFYADPKEAQEKQIPRSNFFALETVNLFGEQRTGKEEDEESQKRAISLAPAWIEPLSAHRRRNMAMEHLREAEEALLAGNEEAAIQEIDRALLREPDNIMLIGRAALIYAATRRYAQASRYFRMYLQHHPDQIRYVAAWGGVLLRLGDVPLAREMLLRATALDPSDPLTRYHGEILHILENNTARRWDRWPILDLSDAQVQIGSIVSERDDLIALIGRDGLDRLCQVVVGAATYEDVLQIEQELKLYGQALQQNAANEVVRHGITLIKLGFHNQWIPLNTAQMCYQNDEVERAWQLLVKIQNEHPEFLPAWYNGGLMALNLQRWESAEYMYKRALQHGYSGQARFALACAYAGQDRIDEAWRILKDLYETEPAQLAEWLSGESPYVLVIKHNPRFFELGIRM